jgi:hypothetical protein
MKPDGGDDPKKSGSEVRRVFHRPSQSLTCHQAIGVSDARIATAGVTMGRLGSHHLSDGGGRNPGRPSSPTPSRSPPSTRVRQFERRPRRTPTAAVAPAKAVEVKGSCNDNAVEIDAPLAILWYD